MTKPEIEELLEKLRDRKYGRILRAKGILETPVGRKAASGCYDVTCWFPVDERPKEEQNRNHRIHLNRPALEELFQKKSPVRLPKRSRI